MVAVGLSVDLAAHSHLIGAAGVLAVVVACLALLRSGRLAARGRGALLLAAGLSPWLLLRMSPWLITLDVLALAGLLLLAVTRSRRLTALFNGLGATAATSASIARSAVPEGSRSKGKAYGRALLLALPLSGAGAALAGIGRSVLCVVAEVECSGRTHRRCHLGRRHRHGVVGLRSDIAPNGRTEADRQRIVAVVRLQTYRSIFGLTMLRFGTTVFATWLGVVVFLVAVALSQPRFYRHLGVAVLLSAYAAVTYGNWANPEAMIARENIARIDWATGTTRSRTGAEFDITYLTSLSDDAVPALVMRLETLPLEQAAALTDRLCNVPHRLDGGWSWNRSRAKAYEARRVLCHWQ